MSAISAPIIIELDLGENGGKFEFRDIDEITVWLNKEQQNIAWMPSVRVTDQGIHNFRNIYSTQFSQLQPVVEQARRESAAKNQTKFESNLAAFKSQAEAFFRPFPRHSSTARSKFIEDLQKKDAVA